MNIPLSFETREKYTSLAELEARCFAAQFTNRLLGHFVLSVLSADLMAPLFDAIRTASISSVSVRGGGNVDLTAQVRVELSKIVDELEGLFRLQAGEQGRAN